ncbi:MAG: hypothetical protein ACR2NV_05495 [Thermoleophilaceae bacterium]
MRAARLEVSLGAASAEDRVRLGRAADGAPATGALPGGTGLSGLSTEERRHAHGRHRAQRRPWQVGH